MNNLLRKYAQLLVNYSLEINEGDKVFIQTTTLAEDLVREIYRVALNKGAHVEVNMDFRGKGRIFYEEASGAQLEYVPTLYQKAINDFDAYLYIRAPFNLREEQSVNPEKRKQHKNAMAPIGKRYFERTATRELKRSLCQFPTQASAQEAGMSLEEYQKFVFGACHLFAEDPVKEWLKVRESQQKIVDLLNTRETIRYKGNGIDIQFSTKGRTWINSDGQTNMPSGEVYTSPVENSVNGVVHFNYPAVYMGNTVEGVTLWVKDGYIEKWEAKQGGKFLEEMLQMDGARRFGEAAIGTNYNIKRFTRNILFDEKIGGTVHMAIGQSYLQAGGKNQSPIHWDMIGDMTQGGMIFADDEKVYENGKFLF